MNVILELRGIKNIRSADIPLKLLTHSQSINQSYIKMIKHFDNSDPKIGICILSLVRFADKSFTYLNTGFQKILVKINRVFQKN